MLTLESFIEKYVRLMDKSSVFNKSIITYPFEFNHLGDLTGVLFPIEIKVNKTEFGWLYSKSHAISFKHLNVLYAVWREELKELVELLLKDKMYGDKPEAYRMVKSEDGGIIGYVHLMDVISLAQRTYGYGKKEIPSSP